MTTSLGAYYIAQTRSYPNVDQCEYFISNSTLGRWNFLYIEVCRRFPPQGQEPRNFRPMAFSYLPPKGNPFHINLSAKKLLCYTTLCVVEDYWKYCRVHIEVQCCICEASLASLFIVHPAWTERELLKKTLN